MNPTSLYKSNNNLNENDQNLSNNTNGEPNPNEDVMIKLIRVVANLAINEIVDIFSYHSPKRSMMYRKHSISSIHSKKYTPF